MWLVQPLWRQPLQIQPLQLHPLMCKMSHLSPPGRKVWEERHKTDATSPLKTLPNINLTVLRVMQHSSRSHTTPILKCIMGFTKLDAAVRRYCDLGLATSAHKAYTGQPLIALQHFVWSMVLLIHSLLTCFMPFCGFASRHCVHESWIMAFDLAAGSKPLSA